MFYVRIFTVTRGRNIHTPALACMAHARRGCATVVRARAHDYYVTHRHYDGTAPFNYFLSTCRGGVREQNSGYGANSAPHR